jgi:phosphate/sulfate permease
LRARPVLGVLAVLGLLIGLMVALVIDWDAHQAIAVAWMIQVLVLVGAAFLLASRIRRRG